MFVPTTLLWHQETTTLARGTSFMLSELALQQVLMTKGKKVLFTQKPVIMLL